MSEVDTNIENIQGGKIVFAEDVVATIAFLAAGEVEGVHAMIGTTMEGLGEKLGKKNYTKGVKVEVGRDGLVLEMDFQDVEAVFALR